MCKPHVAIMLLVIMVIALSCSEKPMEPSQTEPSPETQFALEKGNIAVPLIAFASDRNGWIEMFLMAPNGAFPTQITFTPEPDYNARPSWAPDGRRITYTACYAADQSCEIYIMNADGSNQTNLTDDATADHQSVWSPQGGKIAFTTWRDGNWEVYVMNVDGSAPANLSNHPSDDQYPSWSPNGKKIAFDSNRDGDGEIYIMRPDGAQIVKITDNESNEHNPVWSPDGKRIAFVSDRDGNFEIYVMKSDGSQQTRLTNTPATEYHSTWSPNGKKIAFQTDRDGNYEIYSMNADGSHQTNLTNSPASSDYDPDWAKVVLK